MKALLFSLALVGAHAHAAADPLRPFHADYQVLRNGKEAGRATLDLRPIANGEWEFDTQTKGTAGMAAMLGIDISERSTFRWDGNRPQCLHYAYEQKGGLKSRSLGVDCDWKNATATTTDKGKTATAALGDTAMDRHLVTLALMADLKAGATELDYRVVDKDRVNQQRYVQAASEPLVLPAGNVKAVKVSRTSDDGKRRTTSWFAPLRGWLPVQIEQVDNHGETVTLQLTSAP